MGGINETNLDQVLAGGARRVAMVTAITQAPDIAAKVSVFARAHQEQQQGLKSIRRTRCREDPTPLQTNLFPPFDTLSHIHHYIDLK